jgi:hypothetical protein
MSKPAPAKLPAVASNSESASRWQALFGCPIPHRLPSLVEQAIAWREQVILHGDVSAAIAHDLQLATEHALQRRGVCQPPNALQPDDSQSSITPDVAAVADVPNQTLSDSRLNAAPARQAAGGSKVRAGVLPPAASQLLPGSQLIKAYGGRNHVVAVEADGFRYDGELFSSLSAIAKHITGTHWNGLLFFGLRKRRTYPPKPRRNG